MEDFITYELAVKLKEKGFKWETDYCYTQQGFRVRLGSICCPTISQVLKWLREKKKIHIAVLPTPTFSTKVKVVFFYQISYDSDGMTMKYEEQKDGFSITWEIAALEAIKYVLDNLI